MKKESPKTMSRRLEVWKTSELTPYAKNPRTHSPEQIAKIKNSINEFGFTNPILVDEKKGIIAGHGRLMAAKELRLEEVPVIALTHLTEAQKRAYIIADNQLALEAGWDVDILSEEIQALAVEDFDLSLLGFDDAELAGYLEENEDKKEIEDTVPEVKESICKLGDLWQLGEHRLLCGDCTVKENVELLMNGEKADITFTSPPYNLGVSAKLSGNTKIGKAGNAYGVDGYEDNKTEDEWLNLIKESTERSLQFSRYAFWNIQFLAGNRTALPQYWGYFRTRIVDVMVWDKGHAQPAAGERVLNSRFEFIFIFTSDDNPCRAIRTAPAFRGTIDNVYMLGGQRKNEHSEIHGATFPVEFPETFIKNFCPNGGSVIDLFSGSGSTLIACEKTNRKCYGCEIDPHYCDVIIARFEKYSGKKAMKLEG